MKNFVCTLALVGLSFAAARAHAQDGSTVQTAAPSCFKLQGGDESCVIIGPQIVSYAYPAFNVIDLNGAWAGPSSETPYIYFYADPQYAAGYTIFIDLSLLNRPDAFGYMVDAKTLVVVFPDDRDYTGTLVSPTEIRWSNNTVWTKR